MSKSRKAQILKEKTQALNHKAFVAGAIPALAGLDVFAVAIALKMEQSANLTVLFIMVIVGVLGVATVIRGRRYDAQSKSTSSK